MGDLERLRAALRGRWRSTSRSRRSTSRRTATRSWSTSETLEKAKQLLRGAGHPHGAAASPSPSTSATASRPSATATRTHRALGAARSSSTPRGTSTRSSSTTSSSPAASPRSRSSARGDRSWTEYRLALLDEAARDLVLGPGAEGQPEGEGRHQVPELVRPLPGLGFNLETSRRSSTASTPAPRRATRCAAPSTCSRTTGYQICPLPREPRARAATAAAGSTLRHPLPRPLRRAALAHPLRQGARDHALRLPADRRSRSRSPTPRPLAGAGDELRLRRDDRARSRRTDGSFAPRATMARVAGWSSRRSTRSSASSASRSA